MSIDLAPALAVLRRDVPGYAGAYLFGSHAAGAATAESDVDLAVVAARPLSSQALRGLQEQVAAILRKEVDLVDLPSASNILQGQVLNEGLLVDCVDPNLVGLFELRALQDYRDFKRRRAGIEADIAKRGRVYAR